MSCRLLSLGQTSPEAISHSDRPHEHEQLAYCRLLSLWANEPEALFRRTEMMPVYLFFLGVFRL